MLFRRYADPLPLLDGMLAAGRFQACVGEIISLYNEEQQEKTIWEMWLHKCFDRSYSDFRNSLGMKTEKAAPTRDEQIATVRHSFNMLKGFRPEDMRA